MANVETLLEDGAYIPALREFEIAYDVDTLIKKALVHQIITNQKTVNFNIDLHQLEVFHADIAATNTKQSIQELFVIVATWPKSMTHEEFTDYMNECISHWLATVNDGLDTMSIIQIMSCISLGHANNQTNWHMFTTDIVSETVFSYQNNQISYLLNYDPTTNLPNTNLMLEDIASLSADSESKLTLYCMRFVIERGSVSVSPIIPTTLNNHVLEIISNIFPAATIYQNGDLLFSALIEADMNAVQLNLFSVKIQHAFEQVIDIENQAFIVSPIMCAIQNITDAHSPETYYNQSRTALRHALGHHESFVIHTPEIELEEEKQKKIDLEVTSAFNNEELELYLQPIVAMPEEKVTGAEVLLRWPDAKTKGIYPNVVVEIINKVGLGKLFTRWLVHSVCRLSSELKNKHGINIYLTLNLRAEDLYDAELPHLLIKSAELWKVSTEDIVLEITENGILEENETTLGVINQITEYGFKLALDDFGTGYSSMARLRTLPISIIKIDQSFVRQIDQRKSDEDMVRSMSSLAKSLGKDILVEGVENQASLDIIKSMNIPKVQGYHFSKPMAFDDFVAWAKANQAN